MRDKRGDQATTSRRGFLEKLLLASGFVASGAIAGSAYAVLDKPAFKSPASAQEVEPGPQISGVVQAARPALLPAVSGGPTHDLTIEISYKTLEIAAGVKYNAWTFGGQVPGPFIRVRQGDKVNFTLVNNGNGGHSIDFHAALTAPDRDYKTILPGESLTFPWTASFPGVFMYHCGTAPMLHHIANGMYGAVIVDPAEPLPPATEFAFVQSEFHARRGAGDVWEGDMTKMMLVRPDLLAFNGTAFQYRDQPLAVKAGERIRMYVVNAGPTLPSAFHIVGGIFDKVYVDGNPANVLRGVSTYTIAPGQGCTFEAVLPEPGKYPFVSHNFAYTELGAVGLFAAS
ncbi:MAG TPA: multicopper oxidase domain-containing protein [Dehalococcoidia bacterium]|nr:multicopper oxidase domain-containing protein [Dehalococcoidia bacterium]